MLTYSSVLVLTWSTSADTDTDTDHANIGIDGGGGSGTIQLIVLDIPALSNDPRIPARPTSLNKPETRP